MCSQQTFVKIVRHKKGNFAVTVAFFVQRNLTSHLLYLELSCQLGIVSLLLSKIRLTFVLLIPWRNQNCYTSEPFLKVLPSYFTFYARFGISISYLAPQCTAPVPPSYLPPHDVDTIKIFSPCTTYTTRAFFSSVAFPQLPTSICLEESQLCLKSLREE